MRQALWGLAIVAIGVPGCAREATAPVCRDSGAPSASAIRFAVTTTASALLPPPPPSGIPSSGLQLVAIRVLSRHVNLQELVIVTASEDHAKVTFAVRDRKGVTMTLDPETLQPQEIAPYTYTSKKPVTPPYLPLAPAHALLDDGSSWISVWTDATTARVMGQLHVGPDAHDVLPISADTMDVMGAPRVAITAGRHAVVVFFASTEEGFDLVAASVKITERAVAGEATLP